MNYVDGFVIPMPEGGVGNYRKMAEFAGKLWMEHGALAYTECVLEDGTPKMPEGVPAEFSMKKFADIAGAGAGETVIFAFIVFKSRAHRDEVNAKVHADPRLHEACGPDMEMPFNPANAAYGGFRAIVNF